MIFRVIALFLALTVAASAQVGTQPNFTQLQPATSGGGYTGPLDVQSGATACYSFRACSAALRGTKAVNVCNVSDAACADLSTDPTTGNLVVTTIGGSDCTVVACTVKKIYDQTTSNACTGAVSCDLSQTTISSRPAFIVSCTGGKPCAQFSGGTSAFLASSTSFISVNQIYSISVVAERTGAFTTQQGVFYMNNNGGDFEFNSSANSALMYAGTVLSATASDSAFHAFGAIYNGASSNLFVDGSSSGPGNAGAGAAGGGSTILFGQSGGTSLTGNIPEAIFYPLNATSNVSALSSNQHSYWGF